MKTLAAAAMALSIALTAHAVPTENTFAAVTNDWYVGRWTNVLELAQTRLAVNSNDLVGAHLVVLGHPLHFKPRDAIDRRDGCVKRAGDNKSSLRAKARMGVFPRRVPSAPDGRRCPGAAREVVHHQQDA